MSVQVGDLIQCIKIPERIGYVVHVDSHNMKLMWYESVRTGTVPPTCYKHPYNTTQTDIAGNVRLGCWRVYPKHLT